MSFEQILFYVFSSFLVLSAGAVVTLRNPVHSALALVLAFFNSAALWMMLEAEFLAITLVLVYVGAVMVLFLFVVMMLDINIARMREGFAQLLPIGIVVAVLMFGVMYQVYNGDRFAPGDMPVPTPHAADYENTRELGLQLYTTYVFPFELAAVVLLLAIVAAIALTLRRREGTKYQAPEKQVVTRREDRVRLVKVPSEARK